MSTSKHCLMKRGFSRVVAPAPQVSQMEQEYSLKEQGLDARVRELEECSRSSSVDLTRLLTAQQKNCQRWKEEAKNLTQSFETKIAGLK